MSRPPIICLLAPAVLAASTSGYAVTYLTPAQAREEMFPGAAFSETKIKLTPAQLRAITAKSGVRVRHPDLTAAHTADGAWFLVDEVLGKHEFITYACGIDARGAVTGIEILSYRETYGGEIKDARWRAQFAGKTVAAPLKLDLDIKNISGATLSCRHITDGVKRLLATHALVLKDLR
ncbi:MAG: FMN-binding protein [Opitutae bacterium]|nr:FMN-binding protein [Opitutae bacterium]